MKLVALRARVVPANEDITLYYIRKVVPTIHTCPPTRFESVVQRSVKKDKTSYLVGILLKP